MIQEKNELQKTVLGGKLSINEIDDLISLSENGDIIASSVLLEAYVGCSHYNNSDANHKPSVCSNIDNIGKKNKDDDTHPFFIIEKAALEGSIQAQYEYWRALKHALEEKIINPLLDRDRWSERRNNGLYWQVGFAENNVIEANITLALDYYSGQILEKDYSNTIYYATRALSLDPSLDYMHKLIDSAAEKIENNEAGNN
ncbi:hypothetical protein [Thiolapillus brandeum]|nr:hypothetical protein [Thiolapillus brandeum]